MSSSSAALAQAAALAPSASPRSSRVIVAGGGRDLAWPPPRVAAELLGCSGGRPVHLLLHGGASGADAAIARAARQLGWPVAALPADWRRHGRAAGPIRNRQLLEAAIHQTQALAAGGLPVSVLVVAFPGGSGTASLVQQARRIHAPVPVDVVEVTG